MKEWKNVVCCDLLHATSMCETVLNCVDPRLLMLQMYVHSSSRP